MIDFDAVQKLRVQDGDLLVVPESTEQQDMEVLAEALQIMTPGCRAVVPCQLPATSPANNGDLLTDEDRVEAAWADCAAQIDTVYKHQQAHP